MLRCCRPIWMQEQRSHFEFWRRLPPAAFTGAFAVGVVLAVAAIAPLLGQSRVLGRNLSRTPSALGGTSQGGLLCQAGETIPPGTDALRLGLSASVGPELTVTVASNGQTVENTIRGSAWAGGPVTVGTHRLTSGIANADICVHLPRVRTGISLFGAAAKAGGTTFEGKPVPVRMSVEYLGSAKASWSTAVARRMGQGRSPAGMFVAPFVLLLMVATGACLLLLLHRLVREVTRVRTDDCKYEAGGNTSETHAKPAGSAVSQRNRRIRGVTGWLRHTAALCALAGALNGVAWSFVSPPFQIPDEPSHFAYVQSLAEQGSMPSDGPEHLSQAELVALNDLHVEETRLWTVSPLISTTAEQRHLESDLARPLDTKVEGGTGVSAEEPPVYYAVEAAPYLLAKSAGVLGQLTAMRLFSALFAGLTALFSYLFVMEATSGNRTAATAGGFAVAVFPLLGEMSGGVNPDAMLFATCACTYYLVARAFRRGLSWRLGAALIACAVLGMFVKLNYFGFVPGLLLFAVVLGVKEARTRTIVKAWRASNRKAAIGIALTAAAVLATVTAIVIGQHAVDNGLAGSATTLGQSPSRELSYIWQFYLPPLPGMHEYFPRIDTIKDFWFNGLVGLYGWDVIQFPVWVYNLAILPAAAILVLALRKLWLRRRLLRQRAAEALVYAVMTLGVLVLVGSQSYRADVVLHREVFWEPRYLLPMLALWGLVVGLAVAGSGRRWIPIAATVLLATLFVHNLISQLQVVSRFYG